MQFTPPQYCSPCQDPCQSKVVGSDQVGYTGPNLPCTNVQTCDSLSVALQKIDEQICDLKSTVISLQNQINALTTTTSTSSTTTTSTTTVTPPTTTTTTTLAESYPVTVYLAVNGLVPSPVTIWYDTGSGWQTWNISPGNYPSYIPSTTFPIAAGGTFIFGIRNFSNQDLLFGQGQVSGDFTSKCGISNPVSQVINGVTSIYANLQIQDNAYVLCP